MSSRRTFTLTSPLARLVALAVVAGCGTSGGSTTAPPLNTANFTATVDGSAWASVAVATQVVIAAGGSFQIVGANASGLGLFLTLFHVGAPGTYPLGVGGTVPGGLGTLLTGAGAASWSTPLSGAAGSVTITAVSNTRIAGTFAFGAEPFTGGVTNNRTVTQGTFDLPVTSGNGTIALAPNAGSKFGGTLGGLPWSAATIVVLGKPTATGVLSVGMSNRDDHVTITLSGWTGAGVYNLGVGGVQRTMSVTATTGAPRTWGGTGVTNTGAITVTSATTARIIGTYDVMLPAGLASPGAGTLRLTGAFDFGIP